jgi:hypothetical protein
MSAQLIEDVWKIGHCRPAIQGVVSVSGHKPQWPRPLRTPEDYSGTIRKEPPFVPRSLRSGCEPLFPPFPPIARTCYYSGTSITRSHACSGPLLPV